MPPAKRSTGKKSGSTPASDQVTDLIKNAQEALEALGSRLGKEIEPMIKDLDKRLNGARDDWSKLADAITSNVGDALGGSSGSSKPAARKPAARKAAAKKPAARKPARKKPAAAKASSRTAAAKKPAAKKPAARKPAARKPAAK